MSCFFLCIIQNVFDCRAKLHSKNELLYLLIRFFLNNGFRWRFFCRKCHFPRSGNRPHVFFGISHAQEIVSTYFLSFLALRKSSPRIFCHFSHSGNRPHAFFGISHTQETVPTHFLPFPTLGKSSQKIFLAFSIQNLVTRKENWVISRLFSGRFNK